MKRFENQPGGSGARCGRHFGPLSGGRSGACSGGVLRGAHVNPPSGGLGPPMRTLTHLVAAGRRGPRSTSRAQLRIDGLTPPPRGPHRHKPPQADASILAICDGAQQTATRSGGVLRGLRGAHVNPPGGGLGPPTRTLTHLVAAGRRGPRSTSRAQLRIDGLTPPPRGPRCRKPAPSASQSAPKPKQTDGRVESPTSNDADRAHLGRFDARPERVAEASAQVGPGGGRNTSGDNDALRECDAHGDEGAGDVDPGDPPR